MTDQIQTLHKLYCQLSGFDISLGILGGCRERAWYEFLSAGFDVEDLRLVLVHLKRGIKNGARFPGSMRFGRLIDGLDNFEEELALARAYVRNNQPKTNRQSVIEVFRPVVSPEPPPNAMPVKEVMEKLLKDMRSAASSE